MTKKNPIEILIEFNQKFQNEIQEHKIRENQAKNPEYQQYIKNADNLNNTIQKLQTNSLQNSSECQSIDLALITWKEEVDKYIPFQFLRNKQYQYIEKVKNAKNKLCFKKQIK
ncbi:MAG: hypothetical protein WC934_04955 [Acidithiobacillus sp.]|jgi:hypothetical protein|uniref:hypothetical protein n=1 Tax=Acidithiobacillus sp. TaxID=1872118 RepID=UPI00355E0519